MKQILITGASGFVGSFITQACLTRGWTVHAAIRKTSSRQYLQQPEIQFQIIDFTDTHALARLFKKHSFDAVVHCAGIVKAEREQEYFEVNTSYTRHLVEAMDAADHKSAKFVFISSLAAYGPADQTEADCISAHSTPRPLTAYGRSKLAAEQYIQSQPELPYIILRPTAVYGPREGDIFQFFKLLNKGIEPYIGRKRQQLSFIFVKDLAGVVGDLIDSVHSRKAYFVTDGQSYAADELGSYAKDCLQRRHSLKFKVPLALVKGAAFVSQNLAALRGRQPIFNVEKVKELGSLNWKCDIRPLQNDIGFEPQYLLPDGIKETIDWYLKNKWL